jgi:hypothetical protein
VLFRSRDIDKKPCGVNCDDPDRKCSKYIYKDNVNPAHNDREHYTFSRECINHKEHRDKEKIGKKIIKTVGQTEDCNQYGKKCGCNDEIYPERTCINEIP